MDVEQLKRIGSKSSPRHPVVVPHSPTRTTPLSPAPGQHGQTDTDRQPLKSQLLPPTPGTSKLAACRAVAAVKPHPELLY